MKAQQLYDQLHDIKEQYGTLDVDITAWADDRFEITQVYSRCSRYSLVDEFTDGEDDHLHSIDLNIDIPDEYFVNSKFIKQ